MDSKDSGIDDISRAWHVDILVQFEQRARYHAALRRKYKRAARYPWLPISPDPLPPPAPPVFK